jgi:hypothetical protein
MSQLREISEAAEFVCALANAIAEAASDGKISLGDAASLLPVLYKLPSAIDGLDGVVMADLSLDDYEAIAAVIKEKLELPNDKVEMAVEDSIEIALHIYALVSKLRA